MGFISRGHALSAALLCAATLLPATAASYGLGAVRDQDLAATADAAARFLLELQLPAGGWAWEEAGEQAGQNFGGIVGEALLAAYEQTGDEAFLRGARRYADALVRTYRKAPAALPYKPDLEFLVRTGEVTGELSYLEVAGAWFGAVRSVSPRGEDEVSRIMRGRRSISDISGYDVALGIRAALAVEEYEYARAMADAIIAERSKWLRRPAGQYGTVSRAALLDALLFMDPEAYADEISTLTRALTREQGANGSWSFNETQVTAYAVRALARSEDPEAQRAARRGAAWLAQTLLTRGAWAEYNDGMPEPFHGRVISEVQAEALAALIIAGQS